MTRVTEVTLYVCDICGTFAPYKLSVCDLHEPVEARFIRASDNYALPTPEPGEQINALADTIREWLVVAPQTYDALVSRASEAGITDQPFNVTRAIGIIRTHYHLSETDAGYVIGPHR